MGGPGQLDSNCGRAELAPERPAPIRFARSPEESPQVGRRPGQTSRANPAPRMRPRGSLGSVRRVDSGSFSPALRATDRVNSDFGTVVAAATRASARSGGTAVRPLLEEGRDGCRIILRA